MYPQNRLLIATARSRRNTTSSAEVDPEVAAGIADAAAAVIEVVDIALGAHIDDAGVEVAPEVLTEDGEGVVREALVEVGGVVVEVEIVIAKTAVRDVNVIVSVTVRALRVSKESESEKETYTTKYRLKKKKRASENVRESWTSSWHSSKKWRTKKAESKIE